MPLLWATSSACSLLTRRGRPVELLHWSGTCSEERFNGSAKADAGVFPSCGRWELMGVGAVDTPTRSICRLGANACRHRLILDRRSSAPGPRASRARSRASGARGSDSVFSRELWGGGVDERPRGEDRGTAPCEHLVQYEQIASSLDGARSAPRTEPARGPAQQLELVS